MQNKKKIIWMKNAFTGWNLSVFTLIIVIIYQNKYFNIKNKSKNITLLEYI